MKLEKAIEVLNSIRQSLSDAGEFPDTDAIQLGIEALKCIEATRRTTGCESFGKLPGETPQ